MFMHLHEQGDPVCVAECWSGSHWLKRFTPLIRNGCQRFHCVAPDLGNHILTALLILYASPCNYSCQGKHAFTKITFCVLS